MKYFLYILVAIASFTSYAQEFQFDIRGKNINDIIKYEKKAGGIRIKNTSTYFSGKGIAQPITYERKEKNIPNLRVIYTFQEKDSLMKSILYEWDLSNFEKNDNNTQSPAFGKALRDKYNSLEKMISKKFGQGKIEGDLNDLSKTEEEGGLKKFAVWTLKDSTVISMHATISNYYKKMGAVTITPTHRIRLSVDLPAQKTILSKLSESRVKLLDNIALEVIDVLHKKDIDALKIYLAPQVLSKVTTESVSMLSTFLGNKKMKLTYSGLQSNLTDDDMYVILQYVPDPQGEFQTMLKFIFNDENKIIAIVPYQS